MKILSKIIWNNIILKNLNLSEIDINYSTKPTFLNQLCEKFGCDKGFFAENEKYFSWHPHNYTDLYDFLFSNQRFTVKKVFELGIGTNKVFNSKLVRKVLPGASLRVWKQYFKNAKIFGADVDKETLFNEKNIKTFYVDQYDSKTIIKMWEKIRYKDFDLIIDDGCHQFDATINFFNNSISRLSDTGYYIIEDIYHKDKERFLRFFKKLDYKYYYIELKNNKKLKDNNLFIIKK